MTAEVAEALPTVPLRELTTLRIGGPPTALLVARSEAALVEAVLAADAAGRPAFVLGGGSNVVMPDAGLDAIVILVRATGIRVDADACSGATVEVAAGEDLDEFVARAVAERWTGVETLSGIPGLVGATPIQNVGAYGSEVADVIARVRVLDRHERRIRTFAAAQCEFGFRSSRFKRELGRYVVLSVTFQLPLGDQSAPIRYPELAAELGVSLGDRVPLYEARGAVLAIRRRKGMVLDAADHDTWSVGSFFVNPTLSPDAYEAVRLRVAALAGPDVVPTTYPMPGGRLKLSAAWLLERAGFRRGYAHGGAALSTKHVLAITNRGDATAADVLALAGEIADTVEDRLGVRLEPEPVLVSLERRATG